ncbi:Cellular tumor antigen p53, partial [Dissostichus eleginoides]
YAFPYKTPPHPEPPTTLPTLHVSSGSRAVTQSPHPHLHKQRCEAMQQYVQEEHTSIPSHSHSQQPLLFHQQERVTNVCGKAARYHAAHQPTNTPPIGPSISASAPTTAFKYICHSLQAEIHNAKRPKLSTLIVSSPVLYLSLTPEVQVRVCVCVFLDHLRDGSSDTLGP